ncbi:acid protease [Backusella circina FSU 941]|nr:acid protease [Backusella circina FSU 941]
MRFVSVITIATAIACISAETNDRQVDGIIRAPIIRNPNVNLLEVAKRRYQRLQKRDGGVFNGSLYNDQGSQYLIEVGIGNPAQTFPVTLDTGSADLWVPSSECPSSSCPFYRFDVSKSSSFKNLEKPFNIQYGIGSVNGTYATDTVTVAGASVQNQQFGLASSTADILQPNPSAGGPGSDTPEPYNSSSSQVEANGILGLGYPALTQANSQGEGPYYPFVFNLAKQNIIKEPIFSIFLDSITKQGWSGEIMFGGIDETRYTGNLSYIPVAGLQSRASALSGNSSSEPQFYYWMVYGQGLGVNGSTPKTSPHWRLRDVGAYILDTGTTLTYFPTSVATDIVTAFAGADGFALERQAGVFVVDCKVAKSNSTFELEMSQSSSFSSTPLVLSVPASELVIPLDGPTADKATTCMFGIAPMGSSGGVGNNMYLVGDSVLRSAYMVFDMGKNRVGLATAKDVGGSVSLGARNITFSTASRLETPSTESAAMKNAFSWYFSIETKQFTKQTLRILGFE